MDSKSPDPKLKLEVDLMMLDYLLHAALNSVLDDRKIQQNVSAFQKRSMTEEALDAVDSAFTFSSIRSHERILTMRRSVPYHLSS